jgi:hypothetical protein
LLCLMVMAQMHAGNISPSGTTNRGLIRINI